jgi:xylulokinase
MGIDLGTSGVRVALMDTNGTLVGLAHRPYPLQHPLPNWTEQDPEAWWSATREALRDVLLSTDTPPAAIRGVGLSGQMHGVVLVGDDRKAIRPAIIWLDRRSENEYIGLNRRIGADELYRITGMRSAPGIYAPTLMWLQEHEPESYSRAFAAILPKDYIRLRLTGEFGTDPTDASGTLLFDIRTREWAHRLIADAGLRRDLLPSVAEPTEIAGLLTALAETETGLYAGTPVAVGGSDQAMSAVGCGLLDPGLARCAVGTGGQAITVIQEPIDGGSSGLQVLCHAVPDRWLLMGATLSAGLALEWFRGAFRSGEKSTQSAAEAYEAMSVEAAAIVPGSAGLIFLPYLSGERTPHLDPNARACFIGLDLSHERGHFVRAIMEGVAYSLKDSLTAFEQVGVSVTGVVASGGAARSNVWQTIQANVYGMDLQLTSHTEHSAIGAALIAGVATAAFSSVGEAALVARNGLSAVGPDPDLVNLYQAGYGVYRSLYPALKDVAWKAPPR